MKIIIIGGSGHVGSYLVPRLVEMGHQVVNVCRGNRKPYINHSAWHHVETVVLDRGAEEKDCTFAEKIAALKPDVVIDMICFKLSSAEQLVSTLKGKIQHFLSTGTIWVHGHSTVVPTTEDLPRRPIDNYGIRKAEIEANLLGQARQDGFPATILHPGHIVGEGWEPLNPAGHFDVQVFETLAEGRPLALPNLGLETVHHVHADDVAMSFINAIGCWSGSVGESFHIVSPAAIPLRGYAERAASWFGTKAVLEFLPLKEWEKVVDPTQAESTKSHITHSPNCSIEKARQLIGYNPRYSSLEAVYESVQWLIANRRIRI